MKPLTKRQAEVVLYIRGFIASHGCSPTYEEVAGHLGVTRTTAFGHIVELEAKRVLIRRGRGKSRTMRLVQTKAEREASAFPALLDAARRVLESNKAAEGLQDLRDAVALATHKLTRAKRIPR